VKLTKSQLKQLIKEEIQKVLNEKQPPLQIDYSTGLARRHRRPGTEAPSTLTPMQAAARVEAERKRKGVGQYQKGVWVGLSQAEREQKIADCIANKYGLSPVVAMRKVSFMARGAKKAVMELYPRCFKS